jgi:myo-inositol catabolism protein IolC
MRRQRRALALAPAGAATSAASFKYVKWLGIAASEPGFVSFAIGRTVFWDSLVAWRSKRATRDQTVAEIARRYRQFVDSFERKDAALSFAASANGRPEYRASMEG